MRNVFPELEEVKQTVGVNEHSLQSEEAVNSVVHPVTKEQSPSTTPL